MAINPILGYAQYGFAGFPGNRSSRIELPTLETISPQGSNLFDESETEWLYEHEHLMTIDVEEHIELVIIEEDYVFDLITKD